MFGKKSLFILGAILLTGLSIVLYPGSSLRKNCLLVTGEDFVFQPYQYSLCDCEGNEKGCEDIVEHENNKLSDFSQVVVSPTLKRLIQTNYFRSELELKSL